jgi:hypothetical protein
MAGTDKAAAVNTGTWISGAAHGGLVLWVLVGGVFLRAEDTLPVQSSNVSLISEQEFAALMSLQPQIIPPQQQPVAPQLETAALVAPEAEATPPVARPQLAQPEAPQPEVAPEPPQPLVATPEDLADTAPELPQPPAIDAGAMERPKPDAEAKEAPAPRVAPMPVMEQPPSSEIAETATPAIRPDELATEQQPERPAAAPEQASTEIVTEAEQPAGLMATPRPRLRPNRAKPVRKVAEAPKPEPRPEPKPEPEQVAADPAENAAAEILAALSSAETAVEAPVAVPSGPPLTRGEKDALRVAVQQCWNVGSLSSEALRVTVTVGVRMAETGRPENGSITLLGYQGGNDAAAQKAFAAARRAVIRCGQRGFNLPEEKYARWRDIEMTFNPENMRIK